MTYKLQITRKAQKALAALPTIHYRHVKKSIAALCDNPRPPNCLKLKGREAWRIRAGDYRIIYEIEDDIVTVTVIDIGHRREIYR